VRESVFRGLCESLGGNVAKWRDRRDLTQEALAAKAGLDVRFVQRIERGTVNVGLRSLAALATALEVDPRILLRLARVQPARPGRRKRAAKHND
jgi:transcriptional regulator with XRE-family HTH domain